MTLGMLSAPRAAGTTMKATREPMKRSSNDYVAFIAAEANMTLGVLSALRARPEPQ